MKGIDEYKKDLKHQDVRVRRHAAAQLRYFGPDAAAFLRTATLQDTDPLVRLEAIRSLGWIGDREGISSLLSLMPEGYDFISEEIAEALAELGADSALGQLLDLARDREYPARENILLALGAFPQPEVAEELASILDETESIDEAVACAEALAELKYYRAVPEILGLYCEMEDYDDEPEKDDLRRCLAALIGEPRLTEPANRKTAIKLFKDMGELVPAECRQDHKDALRALKNSNYTLFYRSLHRFSTAAADIIRTGGVTEVIGAKSSPAEEEITLPDTWVCASLAVIGFFKEKNEQDRYELYEGLWPAVCSAYVVLSRLNTDNPGEKIKTDGPARLVEELVRTCTVKSRRLLDKIAACGDEAAGALAPLLEKQRKTNAALRAAEALGRIGTPKAVQALLTALPAAVKDELLIYNIQDALARCGEQCLDQVIRQVQIWDNSGKEEDPAGDPRPGIYACGVLARIRHEKSFQFLYERLSHPDSYIRCNAVEQLGVYGDPAAIFKVRQLIEDNSPEVSLAAKEALVWLCEGNGVMLPELPELKKEIESEGSNYEDYFEDADDDWDSFDGRDYDFDFYEDSENVFNTTYSRPSPVVRGPKTGRNDRCPCGSGKKYKKCCGK